MTVGEAIQLLQNEDQSARLVVIGKAHRYTALRYMRFDNKPIFDQVEFLGSDRTESVPAVVFCTAVDK